MGYKNFQDKLEEQVKKEWDVLISNYGLMNLKLFKSMQEVQLFREKFILLDYTLERLYQGMCFFKSYKPTQNPKYEHPFDNPGNPLGHFTNQLETRFESYLSFSFLDVISDAKNFEVYLKGMNADDYVKQKIQYKSLYENIFSDSLVNQVNLNSLTKDESDILAMYDEYTKVDPKKLIEEYFEDVSAHFGKIAEELYSQKLVERDRYFSEYCNKMKRMIYLEIQLDHLNSHVKRFYFLCLCIFKGKNIDIYDNFEIFHTSNLGEYDEYWWQNDPFKEAEIEFQKSIEDDYGGFRSIMNNIFKNEIAELLRLPTSRNMLQYRYIHDCLCFESIFK